MSTNNIHNNSRNHNTHLNITVEIKYLFLNYSFYEGDFKIFDTTVLQIDTERY